MRYLVTADGRKPVRWIGRDLAEDWAQRLREWGYQNVRIRAMSDLPI